MEEKVDRKVRDNVKLMMSKIAEKNPELKVDIDELTAEPSIDHSNDNVSTWCRVILSFELQSSTWMCNMHVDTYDDG